MKRALLSLLLTFAVLAGLGVLAASFRLPLVNAAIELAATANGVAHPELTVSRFGFEGLELADISGGKDTAVQIARIEIRWSPASLAAGRVERVVIDQPDFRAAITEDGLRIPGIELPEGNSANKPGFALPADRIDIRDARLDLDTPGGPVVVMTSGHIASPPGQQVDGRLVISARGEPASIDVEATLAGPGIDTLKFDLKIRGGAVDTPEIAIATITGDANFGLDDGRPTDGTIGLAASGVALAAIPGGLPGGLRGDLNIDGTWQSAVGKLRAAFTEAKGGRGIRVVADLSDILVANDGLTATAKIDAGANEVSSPTATLHRVSVRLPLVISATRERIETRLVADGQLSAASVDIDDLARTSGPATAMLHPTEAPLAVVTRQNGSTFLVATVDAALNTLALEISGNNATSHALTLSGTTLRLDGRMEPPGTYSGTGRVAISSVTTQSPDLELRDVAAEFDARGPNAVISLNLASARLTDRMAPPRFTPLDISGSARHANERTTFEAALRDATGVPRVTLKGVWPPSGRADAVSVDVVPLDFKPGGLQPGSLIPALSLLEDVRGRVTGHAVIGGSSEKMDLRTQIDATGLSFEFAGIAISNLTTAATLTGPQPLTTPEPQLLTIDRIDTPAPLEKLRVTYLLDADDSGRPVVEIRDLSANLLGGTLSMRDVRLDPDIETAERPMELPIDIVGLDLPALFAVIGAEGLTGTGRLSGRVPLRLSARDIEVTGARLAADGAGVLRIRSEAASKFLAAQGESVDLVLRALDDFHYSELTVTMDRRAGGEARVVLGLLGHNPAVLEGHPFRFNITVNSNVDELLAALLRGYRIATQSLERPPAR